MAVILSCAKVGSPVGGPKDITPPKVVETKPPENSVKFAPEKKIIIEFDEFIQLESIFQELILSPPLEDQVLATLRGKSVVVQFPKETVFDSTTYTLSFGNAIVDNNEGNVLKNYEFVFSLKDYIDSLSVEGTVVNSFNHKPDEERMFVMLYRNMNDSVPYLEKPRYVSRTDEQGNFRLHNLEAGRYRLFGLKDANNNMLFDIPSEQIAFNDSIIDLTPERFSEDLVVEDSIILKSLLGLADTASMDSILLDSAQIDSILATHRKYTFRTEMVFFTEVIKNQYMTNYLRPQPEKLFFSFNEKLKDSLTIEPLGIEHADNWYLPDVNENMDTLIYWITDTSMISNDSLRLKLDYYVYDSVGEYILQTDTLLMMTQKEKRTTRRGRGKDEEAKEGEGPKYLTVNHNVKNTTSFDVNKKIILGTPTPSFKINTDRINFYMIKDTLEISYDFNLTPDTNSIYSYVIDYNPEELTSYKLTILDSAITDIYGSTNDTTYIMFKTQALDYYGVLTMNMSNIDQPVILQLLNEEEKVIKEKFLSSDKYVRFEFLQPQNYMLKLILDKNDNGKWDTGNYLQKLQPEKVIYYKQIINVRSNWEIEQNWMLEYAGIE